jgi:AP-3 complex subunit beta
VKATLVRLQVVTLAAKLLTLAPDDHTIGLLSRYVFSLARYDQDYDVRDRARMLTTLLAGLAPTITDVDTTAEKAAVVLRKQQVEVVLFDGKANVVEPIQCAGTDMLWD